MRNISVLAARDSKEQDIKLKIEVKAKQSKALNPPESNNHPPLQLPLFLKRQYRSPRPHIDHDHIALRVRLLILLVQVWCH